MKMRKIMYSGGELITTEAVAHAVLEYAAQLGNQGRAATIVVPTAALPDHDEFVELLVGPTTQLATEPVEWDKEPPDDAAFLIDIQTRIESARPRPWAGEDWSGEI